METLVPVQLAQVQQRQLCLGRQQQALLVVRLDAGQAGEVLVEQEQDAGFTQPAIFFVRDAVQHRQALAHGLPLLGVMG